MTEQNFIPISVTVNIFLKTELPLSEAILPNTHNADKNTNIEKIPKADICERDSNIGYETTKVRNDQIGLIQTVSEHQDYIRILHH